MTPDHQCETLDSESNWEDVESEQDLVTAKVVEEDESVEAEQVIESWVPFYAVKVALWSPFCSEVGPLFRTFWSP